MKRIFLFSEAGDASPTRGALLEAGYDVVCRILRGTYLDCPISIPPELVVVEPAPLKNLHALVPVLSQHPVVGRVPWILILDSDRVHLASQLPCSDFVLRGAAPAELVARVERLLARRPERETLLRSGPLALDLRAHRASVHDLPVALRPQEFALLRHLVQNAGRALSRDALLAAVWGPDYFGGTRTVDIHIRRLRAQLGESASRHLQTLRHVGYVWQP